MPVSSSTESKCDWHSQLDLPTPAFFFKSAEENIYFMSTNGEFYTYAIARHAVDQETFASLGYPDKDIPSGIADGTQMGYPEGAPFTRLLKGSGEEVYWMENGFRRHIPDMDTFRQLGYRTEDIFQVPDNVLRSWPLGGSLPSVLGTPPEPIPTLSQERVVLSYRPLDRHVRASDLYTVYADGRNPRRLSYTTGYTWHAGAAWSPDGRSIAFAQCLADMPASSECDVAITKSDRWEPQWLAKAVLMHHPVWSPDGTRLAFSQGSLGASIAVMNIDGSNIRPTAVESGYYAWTPDGRIAFWTLDREAPEKTSLMIMDIDGQNIQPVEGQITIYDQRYFPWRQCKWVAGEPPTQ
jgi:hypothetical protein